MDQPNFYAVIPATVRYHPDLMATAKLLYGEITALSNERGYCWASDTYFANLYSVNPRQVRRWIAQLKDFGFIRVQINKEAGNQRVIFLKDSLPLRTKKTYPTDKKDLPLGQKRPTPTDKKDLQNIKDNTTGSITVSRDARDAQNSLGFENQKKEKAPPVAAPPPALSATTFQESIWSTATTGAFARALHEYDPATVDADAVYYRQRCRDWSAQNLHKPKRNWLAFAAQIINDDRAKQKLVTIQPVDHASNTNNSAAGPSNQQSLLDRDSIAQRAAVLADRYRRKQSWYRE